MPGVLLKIGDIVTYDFGPRVIRAKVVEVRGPVGAGGRQLVVIEVEESDVGGEPHRFEMAVDDLTRQDPAAA